MTQQTKTVALGTDFNQPILDINDEPILDENAEAVRLGDMCVNALMASFQDDSADGTQKLKRFNLARKIKGKTDEDYQSVQVNSKHKTMILELAAKAYGTMVYGRIHEALEGTTEDDED
jgi:hypothetical protein